MIIFEKVRWKNFLSTGNQFTEIQLNESQSTMIVGTNGAGKSTILDALCFSLYGKAFRKIKKDQLINTTNEKGSVVEIEFNVNKVDWKIERGIKPNTFKIWRNGEELDQKASAIDQQKWLEQNVLKMNYKSFTQIVILGSSSFVPFMQLPTTSRREVVEDLLDIKIFSSMNVLIKDKIRNLKEGIRTLELKKESLNDKVRMQKNFIDELETRSQDDIKQKESKINNLLTEENDFMNDFIETENISSDYLTPGRKRMLENKKTEIDWELNQDIPFEKNFKTDDEVLHKKFGTGVVVNIETETAEVKFNNYGVRKVYLKFLNFKN